MKTLRYFSMLLMILAGTAGILAGGFWMFTGFALALIVAVGGDALLGDDTSEPSYPSKAMLNFQLYSTWPALLLLSVAYAWHLAPGDLFGIGALFGSLGLDILAAREATSWYHLIGGGLGLGLFYGGAGTVVGHELTHRTWSAPAQIVGRWLLAFTSDASFAIEHVYGHHKNVATREDPATSRRGENAWAFVVRSTVGAYLSACHIEASRLRRMGHSVWSWRNRIIRGNLMTLAYVAFFAWAAGWVGAVAFIAISLYGKAYLEFVNFVEHYGLVRVPGRTGRAAPQLELQQASQQRAPLQPDPPLAPPRARREAVLGPQGIPRHADAPVRLPLDDPRRGGPATSGIAS